MEQEKLVSCIITTFNRPTLVGKAIESILEQTYKNIEIIVVDDHSSESYSDVIKKYAANDSIRFTRNENNLRLSASRNVGIELSRGEFVAFLDDDDIWLPSKIETQVAFLEKNLEYVACTSSHIESVSKKVVSVLKNSFTFEDNVGYNYLGPPSKMLVRGNAARAIRFDEESKHAEDWDFYLKLLQNGPIYAFSEPLIIYDTSHLGRMTTGFSGLSIEQIKEKANMSFKNRALIGERNFNMRLANYFLTGFVHREKKLTHILKTINEIGIGTVLHFTFNKIKKSIKK
jgi:glycosyltransferase involved in cell wall biosynthesis